MSKLTKLLDQRDALVNELTEIEKPATDEARDFTTAEEVRRAIVTEKIAAVRADIDTKRTEERAKDDSAQDETRAQEERDAQARKDAAAAAARNAAGTGNISVGAGEHTYFRGGAYNYLQDLTRRAADIASGRWNPESDYNLRLRAHAGEIAVDAQDAARREKSGSPIMRGSFNRDRYLVAQTRAGMAESGMSSWEAQNRDLSTASGSGGEFVPPVYLTEDYVPFARAGRVFANAVHNEALPPGTMSINIPKIQGGTTVSPQALQNTNVSDTDLQTEYVTFPVITVSGAQVLSLQLIERSPIDFTGVTFQDLAMAQAQAVDQQCLNGTGANGQVTGALNTANIYDVTGFTSGDTYSTIQKLMGTVANAKALIASNRFMPATDIFMTPARWEYFEQQLDGNGRPLIVPMNNGPFNIVQMGPDMAVAQGATGGRLLGLNVWQDNNIPQTLGSGNNQDALVVTKSDDLYLYESPIISRALPQTYGAQLSVLVQLYNYIAFTAARYPTSVAYVTGNGLTNPITFLD